MDLISFINTVQFNFKANLGSKIHLHFHEDFYYWSIFYQIFMLI